MRGLLIVTMLMLGTMAEAQAPATLFQLYEQATKQRQTAQNEMLKTPEGQRFLAWQAQEQGLKAQIDAQVKPAETKPETGSK